MAFNPFSGFAKYKKLWMGGVMILVMITFVLCSGTKGDMADVLLRVFRFGGTQVVSIDGTTYYRQDFDLLVKQRKVANDYMRHFSKAIVDSISDRLRSRSDEKDVETIKLIQQLGNTKVLLMARTKEPKFFDTGTKSDDLINFRVWLAEADRLKIQISRDNLLAMISAELLKDKTGLGRPQLEQLDAKVLTDIRREHGFEIVTLDFVEASLMNEYRVRIAQLADAEYQRLFVDPRISKRINPTLDVKSEEKRIPISPAQLWDFYQENRKEFDVALLPIPVADFVKDIAEPDAKKIEDLFEKYKKTTYDPASETPGFRKPPQIRVQYVSADRNSPFFKGISQTTEIMAQYPIGSLAPQMPLATVLTFAAGPSMFETFLERDYQAKAARELVARLDTIGGGNLLVDPAQAAAAYFAKRNPIALASMIGVAGRVEDPFSAIPALLALPTDKNPEALEATRKASARALAPLFATVVASGSMSPGFASYGELAYLGMYVPENLRHSRPLPLTVVRPQILKSFEERLGEKFAVANLAFFKKKLEEENVAGKPPQVQRLLERYGPRKAGAKVDEKYPDLGLEIATTDKFYDRFTIKTAPELKPLLEAFQSSYNTVNAIEGRDRPETALKDDDFWRLFFDPSETFSIPGGTFNARPWPPVVKLGTETQIEFLKNRMILGMAPNAVEDLFRASANREPNKDVPFSLFAASERPFLFWKIEEKESKVPDSLADVKERVVDTWKMQQAREYKVLPFTKKLALDLLSGPGDYASVLKLEGAKFNQNIVNLERLAPLYLGQQNPESNSITYSKYKLSRDTLSYPRDDTVNHLLTLVDVKEPIKIDFPELDKLNADLFAEAKAKKLPGDKFVQVLTNKPRDTFYLAVVQINRGANPNQFNRGVLAGAASGQDPLFDRAQERLGEEHFRALVQQLRTNHKVNVFEGAKAFDGEGGH